MGGRRGSRRSSLLELVDHLVEAHIRQSVAIVCEEELIVPYVIADRCQPLADVAPDAGVDEGDAPILLDFGQELSRDDIWKIIAYMRAGFPDTQVAPTPK